MEYIMLQQNQFYQSLAKIPNTKMIGKFRQKTDTSASGYLPRTSEGTCSFTTLDFHRAVSQGTESVWIDKAGEAERSGYRVYTYFKGTPFGARQLLNYKSEKHVITDRLFTREEDDSASKLGQSVELGKSDKIDESIVRNSRIDRYNEEVFSAEQLTKQIGSLLVEEKGELLRLNFEVEKKTILGKKDKYLHVIAVCYDKTGENIYVMEPNVGVISTKKEQLELVLDELKQQLYKDFTLGNTVTRL